MIHFAAQGKVDFVSWPARGPARNPPTQKAQAGIGRLRKQLRGPKSSKTGTCEMKELRSPKILGNYYCSVPPLQPQLVMPHSLLLLLPPHCRHRRTPLWRKMDSNGGPVPPFCLIASRLRAHYAATARSRPQPRTKKDRRARPRPAHGKPRQSLGFHRLVHFQP